MKEYIMEVYDSGLAKKVTRDLVRCKDCKWAKHEKVFKNVPASEDTVLWCNLITRCVDGDWFCGDGKRRTETNI